MFMIACNLRIYGIPVYVPWYYCINECPLSVYLCLSVYLSVCLLQGCRPDGWTNSYQNLHGVLFLNAKEHREIII